MTKHLLPSKMARVLGFSIIATLLIVTIAPPAAKHLTKSSVDFTFFQSFLVSAGSIDAAEITIQKTPDLTQALLLDDVTFNIEVANSGDVTLTNVVVNDPLTPSCDQEIGELEVGGQFAYECVHQEVMFDFTNTVTVTAAYETDATITASDSAEVVIINPSISIEKTTATPNIYASETADFQIEVENNGDVPLFDISVSDPLAPNCDAEIETLAVEEVSSYSCSLENVQSNLTNVATVSAVDESGEIIVEDSDDAEITVLAPAITIDKVANPDTIYFGSPANFDFTILNSGNTVLNDIEIKDAVAPICDQSVGSLAPEEIYTFTCTINGLSGNFTNSATVTAVDPLGTTISDSASATISVHNPQVALTVSPLDQSVELGDAVTFTVTIENVGNRRLHSIEVASNVSDCSQTFKEILFGDPAIVYTCISADVQESFVNDLSVTALGAGITVEDKTSAIVNVEVTSGIAIAVAPSTQTIPIGEDAAFTVVLVNFGELPIHDIEVISPTAPECEYNVSTLPPFANLDYECTQFNIQHASVHTMTVRGTPENSSSTLENFDLALVNLVDYSFSVTPLQTQFPFPGGSVSFNVTIDNLGDDIIFLDEITATIAQNQTDPNEVQLINNTCQNGAQIQINQQYGCTFEINLSGDPGEYEVAFEAEIEYDGRRLFRQDAVSIDIESPPMTNVYLPLLVNNLIIGEPNNSCEQAYAIQNNKRYSFLAEDQIDLYQFKLNVSSDIEIRLTNFTPMLGQMVLYYGTCEDPPLFVANNGQNSATKIINVPNQPAGNYILMIVNDGAYNFSLPYHLLLKIP